MTRDQIGWRNKQRNTPGKYSIADLVGHGARGRGKAPYLYSSGLLYRSSKAVALLVPQSVILVVQFSLEFPALHKS